MLQTLILKTSLIGVEKSVVWQRIEIPSGASFDELNCAIQNSFGWKDRNTYFFTDNFFYGNLRLELPYGEEDDCWHEPSMDSRQVKLHDYLKKAGDKIGYEYSDEWQLLIEVKRVIECLHIRLNHACPKTFDKGKSIKTDATRLIG